MKKSHKTDYTFTGKEKDKHSSLLYFGARYYDPSIGRFITPDPLSHKYLSLSPYVYAANNPINAYDPNGLWVAYVQFESRFFLPIYSPLLLGVTSSAATGLAFNGSGDLMFYSTISCGPSSGFGYFAGITGGFHPNLTHPMQMISHGIAGGVASPLFSLEANFPGVNLKNWGVTGAPGITGVGYGIGTYAEYNYTMPWITINILNMIKSGQLETLLKDPVIMMIASQLKLSPQDFINLVVKVIDEQNQNTNQNSNQNSNQDDKKDNSKDKKKGYNPLNNPVWNVSGEYDRSPEDVWNEMHNQ